MKLRFALTAVSFLAAFTVMPAVADDIDLSKITCDDFVNGGKDDAILLLSWIEGYFTKKNDPPIIYAAKVKYHADTIHDYCMSHGDSSLFDAAKAVVK